MIDLHAHILPGLDDGPEDMDESIEMCWMAEKDGIHTIVATPHINPGYYEPSRETILLKVEELNQILSRANRPDRLNDQRNQKDQKDQTNQINLSREMRSIFHWDQTDQINLSRVPCNASVRGKMPFNYVSHWDQINLKVLPGSDIHLDPLLGQRLERGELLSINDKRRYIILELPDHFLFNPTKEFIVDLKEKGITPIISHPERNMLIQGNIDILCEFIQVGALSQITAMSLTGEFGKKAKALAQTFLRRHLTHAIASDAHSSAQRPPILSAAFKEASKIIGRENAWKMVSETPLAIIEGKTIRVPLPQ